MNYIRKHDCQQIMDGFTNYFDTLPDNIIEIILKNNYPIEVYKSNNNELENKKKIMTELEHSYVIYNIGNIYFTNSQIKKLFKSDNKVRYKHNIYNKKLENLVIKQLFYKDAISMNYNSICYLSDLDVFMKENTLNINNYKKHVLLLNDTGLLTHIKYWGNRELYKCICGNYCRSLNCNDSGNHFIWNKMINYTQKHNNNINKIIKNEKKISEYGNKLKFCVDCNKPLKLESVKQHLKCDFHIKNCKH